MNTNGWLQLALYVLALVVITKPMGLYLMQVLDAKGRTWLDPVLRPLERFTYRLMGDARFRISLAPNFSWVPEAEWEGKPFQRFFMRAQETVETVSPVLTITHTWLKPGANKKGVPAVAASFNLHTFL